MIRKRRGMIIGQTYKWDGKGVWEKRWTEMNARHGFTYGRKEVGKLF
jgi:hypothetical protein